MEKKFGICVDAGSENCPCYLAVSGDCLICTRLQGKNECDCDWSGVCIFNEYTLNGNKPGDYRISRKCEIISKDIMIDDLILMEINTGKGFSLQCMRAGTYIFLRNETDTVFYDVPLSLLDVDLLKGSITVCFRALGSKTKLLSSAEEYVMVRGPYRNAISGLYRNMKKRRVLVLARGNGTIPAVFMYNMLNANNRIDLVLNDYVFEKFLVRKYLKERETENLLQNSGNVVFRNFDDSDEMNKVRELMQKETYGDVVIAGSNQYISTMKHIVEAELPEAWISCSNNSVFCCGEGVCGACGYIEKGTQHVSKCKCALVT